MADYCRECSLKVFGEDFQNLAGLITEAEVKQGLGAAVLCERCGFIHVDHNGNKIEPKEGQKNAKSFLFVVLGYLSAKCAMELIKWWVRRKQSDDL